MTSRDQGPASRELVADYSHDHVLCLFRAGAASLTSRARLRCLAGKSSAEEQKVREQIQGQVRGVQLQR
jgi:hypothetical protein